MLEPEVVEDGDNESNCKVFFNFTVAYHLQFEEEREVEKHGLSTGASPEAPVDNQCFSISPLHITGNAGCMQV